MAKTKPKGILNEPLDEQLKDPALQDGISLGFQGGQSTPAEIYKENIDYIDQQLSGLSQPTGDKPINSPVRVNPAGGRTLRGIGQWQKRHMQHLERRWKWSQLSPGRQEQIARDHGYDTIAGFVYGGEPPATFRKGQRDRPGKWTQADKMPELRPVDPAKIKAAEAAILAASNEPAKQRVLIDRYRNMPGFRDSPTILAYADMMDTNTLPMGPLARHQASLLYTQKRRLEYNRMIDKGTIAQQNQRAYEFLTTLDIEDSFDPAGMSTDPQWQKLHNSILQLLIDVEEGGHNRVIADKVIRQLKRAEKYAGRWAKRKDSMVRNVAIAMAYKDINEQKEFMADLRVNNPWLANEFDKHYPVGIKPGMSTGQRSAQEMRDHLAITRVQVENYRQDIAGLAEVSDARKILRGDTDNYSKEEVAAVKAEYSQENLIQSRDEAVIYDIQRGIDPNEALRNWNRAFNAERGRSGVRPPPITTSKYYQEEGQVLPFGRGAEKGMPGNEVLPFGRGAAGGGQTQSRPVGPLSPPSIDDVSGGRTPRRTVPPSVRRRVDRRNRSVTKAQPGGQPGSGRRIKYKLGQESDSKGMDWLGYDYRWEITEINPDSVEKRYKITSWVKDRKTDKYKKTDRFLSDRWYSEKEIEKNYNFGRK